MRLHYDEKADALYLRFDVSQIEESQEVQPGIVLDFNAQKQVVAIEVLRLKERFHPRTSSSSSSTWPEVLLRCARRERERPRGCSPEARAEVGTPDQVVAIRDHLARFVRLPPATPHGAPCAQAVRPREKHAACGPR